MTALVTIRDAWPLHASAIDLTCQAVVLTVHMATAAANRDNARALRLADAVVDLAALHPVRAAGSAARALLSAGKAAALLVVAHRMRRRA